MTKGDVADFSIISNTGTDLLTGFADVDDLRVSLICLLLSYAPFCACASPLEDDPDLSEGPSIETVGGTAGFVCDRSSLERRRVRLALLDLGGDRPPLPPPRAGGEGLREDEEDELQAGGLSRTECLQSALKILLRDW